MRYLVFSLLVAGSSPLFAEDEPWNPKVSRRAAAAFVKERAALIRKCEQVLASKTATPAKRLDAVKALEVIGSHEALVVLAKHITVQVITPTKDRDPKDDYPAREAIGRAGIYGFYAILDALKTTKDPPKEFLKHCSQAMQRKMPRTLYKSLVALYYEQAARDSKRRNPTLAKNLTRLREIEVFD